MSRQPRAGTAAGKVTIRVTAAERRQWERAAEVSYPTLSAAVVAVMNAWARRVLQGGKR